MTPPIALPSMIASAAGQKLSPKTATASTPTKIVANSMLGEVQVQNSWSGRPCRSLSGMNSAPPGSTSKTVEPYVPSRTRTPGSVATVRGVLIACRHLRAPLRVALLIRLLPRYMQGERFSCFVAEKPDPRGNDCVTSWPATAGGGPVRYGA